MSETRTWEVDSCRGHFNNVSITLIYPKHKLIVSCGEDGVVRVWNLKKRSAVQTLDADVSRIVSASSQRTLSLTTLLLATRVVKFNRERPAFAMYGDTIFSDHYEYVRMYDINAVSNVGLLSVRKLGSPDVPPRTLSRNRTERVVVQQWSIRACKPSEGCFR